MKKITALLLCCLSLFLFTGCEGSTTSTEPKTETVENQELTLSMKDWDSTGLALEDIQRTGTYTGEVVDGIPNGTGRFDTQNEEGTSWYYDGEFVNGVFQGQGNVSLTLKKNGTKQGPMRMEPLRRLCPSWWLRCPSSFSMTLRWPRHLLLSSAATRISSPVKPMKPSKKPFPSRMTPLGMFNWLRTQHLI